VRGHPELISSRRNPLVRQLRELHGGRGRREQALLLLEGTHLLQEVRRLGLVPHQLIATEAWRLAHPDLLAPAPHWPPWQPVSAEVLAAIATTEHPDGVVLTLAPPSAEGLEHTLLAVGAGDALLVVLDGLQDPGNLGTLLRTALAAGATAAWLAEGADPFQPKVLRASAGAVLELPIWRGSRPELLARLERAAAAGLQLVATLPPSSGARPYWELDWCRPTALLLGNEGAGLAPELQARAHARVTIPHSATVESLNVAVAAAPLLLERLRQRARPGAGGR
jgi:TrmH family RNA methyltransferase